MRKTGLELFGKYHSRLLRKPHSLRGKRGERPQVIERSVLRAWAASLPQPWHGAMEATIFSAWIYDTLKPHAERLDMGHPAKMKAITAGKKKSDAIPHSHSLHGG